MRGLVPKNQPPQRDPIFRDAKVLLFWCDQQQKELLVRYFPFVVTVKGGARLAGVSKLASLLHQIQHGALYLL